MVVYPYMVVPLFVGRERSIKALEVAMAADKQIYCRTKKMPQKINPTEEGFIVLVHWQLYYSYLKLPDGTVKVLIEGVKRAKVCTIY